jgi:hypothetical protein
MALFLDSFQDDLDRERVFLSNALREPFNLRPNFPLGMRGIVYLSIAMKKRVGERTSLVGLCPSWRVSSASSVWFGS